MQRIATLAVIVFVSSFAASTLLYAEEGDGGVVEVKLGATVERTLEQVKADNFAYGPKQEFDAKADETHVYLPYGGDHKLYAEVKGQVTDPKAGDVALGLCQDGNTNFSLTYKLHFDKPIGSFRFYTGWAEMGLADDTVAGVEYSTDGKEWKTIKEYKGSDKPAGIIEPLVKADTKVSDLKTDTLYIRYYSRDPKNPEASGPGRWFKIRMSGDPSWGDAAQTFFRAGPQVWVAPAKAEAKAG